MRRAPACRYCGNRLGTETQTHVETGLTSAAVRQQKIRLGRKLSSTRRLSGDGFDDIATCHNPGQSFTDSQEISLSYHNAQLEYAYPRQHRKFAKLLFHDGRTKDLEKSRRSFHHNVRDEQESRFCGKIIQSFPVQCAFRRCSTARLTAKS